MSKHERANLLCPACHVKCTTLLDQFISLHKQVMLSGIGEIKTFYPRCDNCFHLFRVGVNIRFNHEPIHNEDNPKPSVLTDSFNTDNNNVERFDVEND
jgi:hypothetical protein